MQDKKHKKQSTLLAVVAVCCLALIAVFTINGCGNKSEKQIRLSQNENDSKSNDAINVMAREVPPGMRLITMTFLKKKITNKPGENILYPGCHLDITPENKTNDNEPNSATTLHNIQVLSVSNHLRNSEIVKVTIMCTQEQATALFKAFDGEVSFNILDPIKKS